MKKLKCLFFTLTLFFITQCTIFAASNKDNIKKLINTLSPYEHVILLEFSKASAESQQIALSEKEMAQAAAFSINKDYLQGVRKTEFGVYDTYLLPYSKVKNAEKNIFGKTIAKSKFPKQNKETEGWLRW